MHIHRSSRLRRVAAVSALGTAIALAATACAAGGASARSLTEGNHIHDLVPAEDGRSLLVGTHNGLFSVDLESGQVAGPAGEQVIDLMGLSATEDGLIASGHPGASGGQDLQGPNLGLIRSADAGESWEAVSLEGVADFHALTYDPTAGAVIGSQGGQLLISDDMGQTWRQGAAAEPYDLLPTSGGVLMTSVTGLSVSTDAGMTFGPVEGAPPLVLIGSDGDVVVGVDLDGTLWRSESGSEWTAEGATPEQVHAMTIVPGGEVIVATSSGLQRSGDLGESWRPLVD
ncbi:MAG: sialidase family protein [Agrococcus sp.]